MKNPTPPHSEAPDADPTPPWRARWRHWIESPWRDRITAILPTLVLLGIAIWAALHFIDPAPPMKVTIATGTDDSAYADFARRYQTVLANDGVTLNLESSAGAADNLLKLRDEDDDSRIAFVQDGLSGNTSGPLDDAESVAGVNADSSVRLVSLGSVSYEPIWIFYRGQRNRTRLSELAGMRIAVGEKGSGTHVFASRLLIASGVPSSRAQWVSVPHSEGAQLLIKGRVDAAFFMGAPDSELIRSLLRRPSLHVLNLDQADAFARQFPYLHALVLPHGSIDLAHNTPAQDLHLLATTTTVVVTENLHPALVALLMKAMQKTHAAPTLLNPAREFPSAKDNDFVLSKDAAHFYQSGPPFLQRYLPFWLATLVDRAALAILPILAILVPIVKTAPALYFWRLRRRIYHWYGELKYLEIQLGKAQPLDQQQALLRQLDHIEEKVKHAQLPLAFTEHIYVLREHMDLVRRKISPPPSTLADPSRPGLALSDAA